MSDRKKITLAIAGSLVLHILLIFGAGEAVRLWPAAPIEASQEKTMPELTLLDTPPPQTDQKRQYLRTNDDQKADKKPDDAMFESDKDTAAASEKEAKSGPPIPTQDGKDTPDIGFKDERYSLADNGQTFSTEPGKQAQEAAEASQASQQQATPTPAPTPTATPMPSSTPTEMAMLRPAPTPNPRPPSPKASRTPERQSLPPTAYRQEQRANRMQGNITNRGRSSIAAVGTPWGRFQKAVQDAIGSRWYYYIRDGNSIPSFGTAQIRFYIRADGKVEDVKVISNTSNETLASESIRAIINADIPPMPEDLAPVSGDRMEFTETFSIVPN
jgi:outer membrane biosynthesis protein TonB